MSTNRRSIPAAAAALLALLAGCSYYDLRYEYGPAPLDVSAAPPGAARGEPVRTLATVIGVRKPDGKAGLPAAVELRLRVENTSPWDVTFDPSTLALYTAGLEPMPAPRLAPGEPVSLQPGGTAVVDALFPFPAGRGPSDYDLDGLNARWTLVIDGEPVTSSATFMRRPDAFYDRYPRRMGIGYHVE